MKRICFWMVLVIIMTMALSAFAGSKEIKLYCHKNGADNYVGTVNVSFVLGSPSDSREPAQKCNNIYSSCGDQCWGCTHWGGKDSASPACCYLSDGSARGAGCAM